MLFGNKIPAFGGKTPEGVLASDHKSKRLIEADPGLKNHCFSWKFQINGALLLKFEYRFRKFKDSLIL